MALPCDAKAWDIWKTFTHSNGYSLRIVEVQRSRDEQKIISKQAKTYNLMYPKPSRQYLFLGGDEWLKSKQELAKFGLV